MDIQKDPIINAIYKGIKKGIEVAFESGCLGSALILIYSGIDAMAYLSMPESQKGVRSRDFKQWVTRYIQIDAKETITTEEFYSARCAVLHTYGVESGKTRSGHARMIGYMVGGYPPIRFNPNVSKDLVLLEVGALKKAFFAGVDQFIVDSFADAKKRKTVESRLQKLLTTIQFDVKNVSIKK